MNILKNEDKNKISQILHNNWDLIFKLLVDSSTDEYGIPYRELYKWELSDREKELPEIIDIHLKNGEKKGIAVNSIPIRRLGDLFGTINQCWRKTKWKKSIEDDY